MNNSRISAVISSLMICIAAFGMFLFPGFGKKQDPYAGRDKDGNIVIKAEDLSSEKVSFIRIAKDSKIELLAILDEDGEVKISLGTCQSCNGSPYAYYVQKGNRLICNNCGQAFPLSEIGKKGGGCHPILIPEEIVTKTEDGITLDTEAVMEYEKLFEKVIAH